MLAKFAITIENTRSSNPLEKIKEKKILSFNSCDKNKYDQYQ